MEEALDPPAQLAPGQAAASSPARSSPSTRRTLSFSSSRRKLASIPRRPGSRLDALMPGLAPLLDLRNPRTGESWSGWFADSPGGDEAAIAELEWFFRDWREVVCVSICKRVLYGLAGVSAAATASIARALEIGGVGLYPAEGFAHIDSGRVCRWTGRRRG